ncbi:hypothetical protein [Nocardioides nitrophenolicus]|uniref:hypothetical protein n=1 Tax=Nocardioides nitrophenolicus TaxID=60489 RepID=UPI00195982F2|nr:hypothetical protein [Nocardioides nitrophenolicus]MBM7520273.1 hypothetical protein [Nocardioides nitrophenolicus]
MGRTGKSADLVGRNLRALHGALEHSVTIQMARLQGLMDDLVARGSLTRAEADQLLGQLVSTGRAYSQALLQVLDTVRQPARLPVPKLPLPPIPSQLRPGRRRTDLAPVPAADVPDNVESLVVPDLARLTIAQVKPRLAALGPDELRRVREREVTGRNRKGVLAEIDRLLS